MADCFASRRHSLKKQTRRSNDKTVHLTHLLQTSPFVSVLQINIICLILRLWQIIDLLATDKSRYFAQPLPIIVKYSLTVTPLSEFVSQTCTVIKKIALFIRTIQPDQSSQCFSCPQRLFYYLEYRETHFLFLFCLK